MRSDEIWARGGTPTRFCEVVEKRRDIFSRVQKMEKSGEGGEENKGVRGSETKVFCEVLANKGISGEREGEKTSV